MKIFAVRSLISVDLSQNHFREEGLAALAIGLGRDGCNIKSLNLAGNGCAWVTVSAGVSQDAEEGKTHPMLLFAEMLKNNTSLTALTVSECCLDSQCALCIEDGLCDHPNLTYLDISRNPLGEHGLRSIVRLISIGRIPLQHVDVSKTRPAMTSPNVIFNYG